MNSIKDEIGNREEVVGIGAISPKIGNDYVVQADPPYSMKVKEYEFISENPIFETFLSVFGDHLRHFFPQITNYRLELFDEGEGWKTLFIIAEVDASYEKVNEFFDHFLDLLLKEFPEIFNVVNLDLRPR